MPTPNKPKEIIDLEEYWGFEISDDEYKVENGLVVSLTLAGKGITHIEPVANLTNLSKLDLYSNQITDIQPVANLINLSVLYLSHNQITDIEPVANLTNLSKLDLHNNQITDIQPVAKLINLSILDLSGNQITDIQPVAKLINLSKLYLEDNQITDIQPTANLINLSKLDLSQNQITDIHNLHHLLSLEKLEVVTTDNNPVCEQLPREELKAGWPALKQYLLSQQAGSNDYVMNEVKVLLLGNTNVGKTTLVHYLEREVVDENIEPTHGIEYHILDVDGIRLHTWDFGGQEYFHATHKLFFSPGALHILLWNNEQKPRDGEQDEKTFELQYWLRCSQQLCNAEGDDTVVLVTENKIDNANPHLLNQTALQEKYPQLQLQFTAINLIPPKRLEGFKELLQEAIKALPILQEKRPNFYETLLKFINKQKLEGKKVILVKDFPKSFTRGQVQSTMRVFHLMGFLLYFKDQLEEKVFIDPKALLELLYDTILSENAKTNNGIIEEKAIKDAIKKNPLGLSFEEVIDLLQYFDLVFQIPNDNRWFAPQYLPKEEQVWLDFFTRHHFSFPNVRIQSDSYLMNLALLKLFSQYGGMVKRKADNQGEHLFWRDGLVIEKGGQVLLIKFRREEQTLELYGDKEGKNLELQQEVIMFISAIDNPNVNFKEFIKELFESSINILPSILFDVITFGAWSGFNRLFGQIEADDLINSKAGSANNNYYELIWNNSKFDILLSNNGHDYIPWKELYKSQTSSIVCEEKLFLVKDFLQFLPKNKMPMKKIFISYSKADLKLVNHFIDHLSALKINGSVETWYCTDLKPGEKWDETIKAHFDAADILCFMVSPNFMKTDYIHQYEVARAFERVKKETAKPPVIVPILLDFCDWKTIDNDLTAYNALPYKLKPVTDFKNENEAWYLIILALKSIIHENDNPKDDSTFRSKLPAETRELFERIIDGKA